MLWQGFLAIKRIQNIRGFTGRSRRHHTAAIEGIHHDPAAAFTPLMSVGNNTRCNQGSQCKKGRAQH